jgi:hypothetical protein
MKETFNTTGLRQFFSWNKFNSLQHNQQLTILQTNNQFHCDFRSLLITGFRPSEPPNTTMWQDDIPIQQECDTNGKPNGVWQFTSKSDHDMHDEDINDRFHNNLNLTTTTITDYIQRHFLSGDKSPLFAHVYDPIQGTREVLVPIKHVPEALSLIKHIKAELCRVMHQRSIELAFDNIDEIITITASTPPWQPFDIQTEIVATATSYQTSNITHHIQTKIHRQLIPTNPNSHKSYS